MSIVRQSNRAFGLTFACLFAIIFVIFHWIFDFNALWAIWVSLVFIVISLMLPWLLLPLNRIWAVIGSKISYFNNHLFLGIFFVLVMLPAGIILKIFGYNPMKLKMDIDAETYWESNHRHTDSETLKDMF